MGSVRLLGFSDPQFSHRQDWNIMPFQKAALGAECGDVSPGPCVEWHTCHGTGRAVRPGAKVALDWTLCSAPTSLCILGELLHLSDPLSLCP